MTLVVQPSSRNQSMGRTALAACATLDGIAGAVIWARHLGSVDNLLFAPEGETGSLFTIPALASLPNLTRLYCFSLPLSTGDIPALTVVLNNQVDLRDRVWIDNHFIHPEHLALLQGKHMQILVNPTARWASTELLQYLGSCAEWERDLVAALDAGPAEAPSPWNEWLNVMLAVIDDVYSIRHAVAPLVEERFAAYDPALVEEGRRRQEHMRELSRSPSHVVTVNGIKIVVIGLPPSEQTKYRLIADVILKENAGHLGLIFFDGVNRLVLRRAARESGGIDLLRIGSLFTDRDLRPYHYDAHTLFIEHARPRLQEAIENILEILQAHFSMS